MATEYGLIGTDTTVAALMCDDKQITIVGPKADVEPWSNYFRNDMGWEIHRESETPLQSLMGRSTHKWGTYLGSGQDARSGYEKAVAEMKNPLSLVVGHGG